MKPTPQHLFWSPKNTFYAPPPGVHHTASSRLVLLSRSVLPFWLESVPVRWVIRPSVPMVGWSVLPRTYIAVNPSTPPIPPTTKPPNPQAERSAAEAVAYKYIMSISTCFIMHYRKGHASHLYIYIHRKHL